jgi:branched-chain amino acid transport system permease protein
MILADFSFQTLTDAIALGAIYALMAVGIGLVFGVLRLVNFAYGQLIMVGAYTLAFTSSWPLAASLLTCFAVVVAFSLLMDLVVFRPLRDQSPAVMLVTTFAIAFLLQAIALIVDLRDDFLGQVVGSSITSLNESISIGGVDVRKVTIVAVGVTLVALLIVALLLGKTTIGLHTRAAASDFRTARLLGVRANRVITFAVVLSGLLAAAVAMLMVVGNPLVTPQFALEDTIIVLVGVVVGGIDRLWTATLGGFAIGFASGVINGLLPTESTVYVPSVLFGLVIVVLLLRPAGLFAWGRRARVERV